MMKTQDVKVAVALVLQGYMAANAGLFSPDELLAQAIGAVRQEATDWAENLDGKPEFQKIANAVA